MKIAMYNVTTTIKHGGIETFVWEVGKRLVRSGYEIHVIGGKGLLLRNIPKINVYTYPFLQRMYIPNLGKRFRKLVERITFAFFALPKLFKERYDMIYIHKPYDLPIAVLINTLVGSKICLGCHGTDFFPTDRFFAKKIDLAVSCSQFNAKQIKKRYGISPHVIYNGVDVGLFRPLAPVKSLKNKLGIGEEEKVVIYVGRLIGWKGIRYLVEAMKYTRKDVKLVIVGEGEERGFLEREVNGNNLLSRVVFAGSVPHQAIPRYYSLANVAVFPSVADETFGISIAEAMACGVPVISTKVGGIPEVIEDGINGILVHPRDPEEIGERLNYLLSDHEMRRNLGKEGRRRIEKYFTWDQVVANLEEVLSYVR